MSENYDENDIVDLLLEENNFWIRKMPEEPGSLIKSISDCLYFTFYYYKKLEELCLYYVEKNQESLSDKFGSYVKDLDALKENFFAPQYNSLKIYCIAKIFKVQINIYFVVDFSLNSEVYNTSGTRTLRIMNLYANYFCPLMKKKKKKLYQFCQKILLNILTSQEFGYSQGEKIYTMDQFYNFYYDQWKKKKQDKINELKALQKQIITGNQKQEDLKKYPFQNQQTIDENLEEYSSDSEIDNNLLNQHQEEQECNKKQKDQKMNSPQLSPIGSQQNTNNFDEQASSKISHQNSSIVLTEQDASMKRKKKSKKTKRKKKQKHYQQQQQVHFGFLAFFNQKQNFGIIQLPDSNQTIPISGMTLLQSGFNYQVLCSVNPTRQIPIYFQIHSVQDQNGIIQPFAINPQVAKIPIQM